MERKLIITGAILGLIAIILGAFATHGLKPLISAEAAVSFETGVRYQMYSAFFLLFLGVFKALSEKVKKSCFYLTTFGVILFSGSIYLLATNALTSLDFTVIALLTPLGGTLLIIAWIVLVISGLKLKIK